MKRAVISLSGGMDSTCLLVNLLAEEYDEITAVSFDYGQNHRIELELAARTVSNLRDKHFNITHQIIDIRSLGTLLESSLIGGEVPKGHYEQDNMKSTVVPNRNVIFSSMVYAIAQSKASKYKEHVDIALGVHAGDHAIYPDCRPESIEAVEKAFKLSNYDAELVSYIRPYIQFSKTDILYDCVKNCVNLGLRFDDISVNTITSYNPDSRGRSSGTSGSDIERIEAFINLDRKDPIEYQKPWDEIVAHALTVLK